MLHQTLAEKIHKSIIRKSEKRKVHSCFKVNIQDADLPGMQLISKFNQEFVSYYVTAIYSKYAWPVALKDEKVLQLLMLLK